MPECVDRRIGENADTKPRKYVHLVRPGGEDRSLFVFARLWMAQRERPQATRPSRASIISSDPDDGGQSGCRAHPFKAMLVILTSPTEVERWLEAETPDGLALRPLADETR